MPSNGNGGSELDVGVVVVEALPVVRAGVALLVDGVDGCRVLQTAGTPTEALAVVGQSRRERMTVLIGLATADDTMDAYGAIREVRQRHPAVGVVAMAADADAATISRALFVGADGYADTRSDPHDFCEALIHAADHLMVLTGPSRGALGEVAEALMRRSELEHRLTPREREVLILVAEGLTASEVATRLGIRERTVTTHLTRIYQKLGVGTRLGAVRAAAKAGLVDDVGLKG